METVNHLTEVIVSRPLLLVTGVFYIFLGYVMMVVPVRRLSLIKTIIDAITSSSFTYRLIGASLLVAGVLTAIAAINYSAKRIRIAAAALRAGSMSALEILVILVTILLPNGSFISVVVFGYLAILSFLTLPPSQSELIGEINKSSGRRVIER